MRKLRFYYNYLLLSPKLWTSLLVAIIYSAIPFLILLPAWFFQNHPLVVNVLFVLLVIFVFSMNTLLIHEIKKEYRNQLFSDMTEEKLNELIEEVKSQKETNNV